MPPEVFHQLAEAWHKSLPNLVCKDKVTFCYVREPCESVVKKVKPVSFQMSDYIFEIDPDEYLLVASKNKCFFVIHRTDLGDNEGEQSNIFMIGDLFLKHFYSVYDLDRDEVALGVNTHSAKTVRIRSPIL